MPTLEWRRHRARDGREAFRLFLDGRVLVPMGAIEPAIAPHGGHRADAPPMEGKG